jgi:hypothetical protein
MKASLVGLNTFVTKTKKQQAQIKQGAENFVRNKVKAVLKDLVLEAPQWSGNTAASWRIDLNYMPAVDYILPEADWRTVNPIRFRGGEEAWTLALAANRQHLAAIKYNSIIRIINKAPYADDLATKSAVDLRLREGNYIPGDILALRFVEAKHKFGPKTKLNLRNVT